MRFLLALLVAALLVGHAPDQTTDPGFTITVDPTKQPNCPNVEQLAATGPGDKEGLVALLPAIMPLLYREPDQQRYEIARVEQAANAGVYGEMIANWCGPEVAASSWVVMVTFPQLAPSASLSQGQFFLSRTKTGWNIWYRYH